MPKWNMVQALQNALRVAMQRDPAVVVLGEDVGVNGGVFRVTDGLYQEFGPERVIDTPLAEAAILGTAMGMAVAGLKPVAEIQFDGFVAPAHEQLVNHIARVRWRSRGRFSAPMVIRVPSFGGIRALEHHSESIEAWYVHTPGLKVVVPSTPYDAKGLLLAAIEDPDPVLFLEPKRLYRAFREEVPEEYYTVPIGPARVVREGRHVSLFTYGSMVPVAIEAADRAREQGVEVEVIDLRTLSPLDEETIAASVRKTGRAVVLNEAPRQAGLAAEVAAIIGDRALLYLEAPVERVTGYDTPMPYLLNEDLYLPDADRVLEAITAVHAY